MSSSPLSWGECQGSGVQSAPPALSHPLPKALGTLLQTPFTLGPRSPCFKGSSSLGAFLGGIHLFWYCSPLLPGAPSCRLSVCFSLP